MEEHDRSLIAEVAVAAANPLDRQQGVFGFATIRRIVFLPVAIKTEQTGESISLGSQMPTAGRTSRPGWYCQPV